MKKPKPYFNFSIKDCAIAIIILAAVTMLSFLLRLVNGNDLYVPMLFVTAVFLVSRFTDGYLFGTLASFVGVILVNYIFTYPYLAFNFTISGYPITFISMFITSVMTSTMTTRIKHAEKIKSEAEKEKMRANLLRAISHDLRTPLTSIVGTVSALLDNDDKFSKEQKRVLLNESRDDAEWLISMVENLLSITRMNGGKAEIKKSEEAAEEIVGSALTKFSKRFPDVSVVVTVPDELLLVPMDATLIEQVLINLLENAIIHGGNSQGIEVSVTRLENEAVFKVTDKGKGIPENVFPHLFTGNISGNNSSVSDNKRNMGIGLSVCMSIVKAHGGHMTAKNKSDGGAAFSFTLPLENI